MKISTSFLKCMFCSFENFVTNLKNFTQKLICLGDKILPSNSTTHRKKRCGLILLPLAGELSDSENL